MRPSVAAAIVCSMLSLLLAQAARGDYAQRMTFSAARASLGMFAYDDLAEGWRVSDCRRFSARRVSCVLAERIVYRAEDGTVLAARTFTDRWNVRYVGPARARVTDPSGRLAPRDVEVRLPDPA